MCAITFLKGQKAYQRLPACLKKLEHRGPDEQHIWRMRGAALGFNRLAINGQDSSGRQAFIHGEWVGAVNGEVYNFKELIQKHELDETIECDTQVVLPLFYKIGRLVIDELDGFYAGLLFNTDTDVLYLLRDYVRKKPLFYGCSGTEIFVTSELKAIDKIDWFRQVPSGCSCLDLHTGEIIETAKHEKTISKSNVVDCLTEAVRKRLPTPSQPLGIFLSGGLDSSVIASIVSKFRKDAIYFTLGEKDAPDHLMAIKVAESLGLKNVRNVKLPSKGNLSRYIREVVYSTESFNPSIISNGLATYLLSEATKKEGIKIVLTGEGADELFGGYYSYQEPQELDASRLQLVTDMHFTELRRLDLCTMAHGVEARCPFLDRSLLALSEKLATKDLYEKNTNKAILRESFRDELPKELINRKKISFDVGSGVRGLVVNYLKQHGKTERAQLYEIWQQMFYDMPMDRYFFCYPAFDEAIDRRGEMHR